jgi:hypothetical protein
MVGQGILFYKGHTLAPFKIMYFLLGGLANVVRICVLIWMPDSAVHTHFVTREECIAAPERVRDDQGGTENTTLKKYQIIEAFTDTRGWSRAWLIILITMLSRCFLTISCMWHLH